MIFLYSPFAGEKNITLQKSDENFLYLTKVKRHATGDQITLSNLEDGKQYEYIFTEISGKKLFLEKSGDREISEKKPENSFHLAWGICDPKTIFKTLPFLNEIGVSKITFVECERTQGNFLKAILSEKFLEKTQKILEQSCQQCGRNNRMQIEISDFSQFLKQKTSANQSPEISENFFICDFSEENPFPNFPEISGKNEHTTTVMVGPEGGFSPQEKEFCAEHFPKNRVQFATHSVLRSETAVIGMAGKFLL